MARTVVFLHGAWVTPLCWERFVPYFEKRGFRTQSPAWPGKDASEDEQRRSPSPSLRGLGIREIVEHYERLLSLLPDPPFLVGHSFGGLFVEILLDRGLGAAGVAIDPAPPKGIFAFYPSAFRSLSRVLTTWKGWNRILRMPFSDFQFAFVNGLAEQEQRAAYERYVVPETGRIFFQAAFSPVSPNSPTKVNFRNPARRPLLVIAGGADHIVPPQINRANFRRYGPSTARTDFKEFAGRGHWIIAEHGWEEVAAYAADWLSGLSDGAPRQSP